MARFAQVDGIIVTGLLQTTEKPTKLPMGRIFIELADDQDVQPGDQYDATAKTFTRPVKPPPPPKEPTLTEIKAAIDAIATKVGAGTPAAAPAAKP